MISINYISIAMQNLAIYVPVFSFLRVIFNFYPKTYSTIRNFKSLGCLFASLLSFKAVLSSIIIHILIIKINNKNTHYTFIIHFFLSNPNMGVCCRFS